MLDIAWLLVTDQTNWARSHFLFTLPTLVFSSPSTNLTICGTAYFEMRPDALNVST
jgi:hypothetical protein